MIVAILLVVALVVIVACRLLARSIREVNRYDMGMPPRRGRKL